MLPGSAGACPGTQQPKYSAAQVRRAVFGGGGSTVGASGAASKGSRSSSAEPSLSAAFQQCSQGKAWLTPANSMVADLVQLNCMGTS